MRLATFLAILAAGAFSAPPVDARDLKDLFSQPIAEGVAPLPQERFGGGIEKTVVPIQSFVPIAGAQPYTATVTGYYQAAGADVLFWAPLSVPLGASVTEVCFEAFDNDAAEGVSLILVAGESGSAGNPAPVGAPLANATTGVAPTPGYTQVCAVPVGGFTFPLSVRTTGNADGVGSASTIQYYLLVALPATAAAGAVRMGPAVVSWQRVVSPAPATATFNDVPTSHPFFRFIEAFSRAGITGGCGGGNYCPDNPVTRGQMATFLAVAFGLHFPD